ncbi:hypothetical protein FRB99_005704 [Tulasnella sp. 403]|nr:hypothetical protein FRB99_005704 [Tulasnella sp. 403]
MSDPTPPIDIATDTARQKLDEPNQQGAAAASLPPEATIPLSSSPSSFVVTDRILTPGIGAFGPSPPLQLPPASRSSRSIPSPRSFGNTSQDYFSRRPEGATSRSAITTGSTRRRKDEWTVFGQLLEDDRTPGIRGSDTPVHTVRASARSPLRPDIPSDRSGSALSTTASPSVAASTLQLPPNDSGTTNLEPSDSPGRPLYQDPAQIRRQSFYSATDPQTSISEDSDTDEDTDTASISTVRPDRPRLKLGFCSRLALRLPSLTPLQRNILKCTIAYFIGSLFTYWPLLSDFLTDFVPLNSTEGPSPTGHMVATVVVYFNPAKTIGAMFEADTYCLVAAVFSSVVCLTSMGLFWLFEDMKGMEFFADSSVFLCIGVAMSAVAWAKLWMERPSFNTACSMTSIMIFIVVVKEGGAEMLLHVLFIVLTGSVITNLVCFLLWPQSATTNLQNNMVKVLDSFATLLDMTTQTFLMQESYHPKHSKLLRAVEEHQASFTSLKKNLVEAKSEWCDSRIRAASQHRHGREYELYDTAIAGLTRLAQHLNGLRDGTRLQFDMAAQGLRTVKRSDSQPPRRSPSRARSPPSMPGIQGEQAESTVNGKLPHPHPTVFADLVDDMGPPLDALANACTSCLKRMRAAFKASRSYLDQTSYTPPEDFREFAKKIERALFTFEHTSNQAVLKFFRRADESLKGDAADNLFVFEDNESVFLIYFFIFTLQEFARELINLTDVMGAIDHAERRALAETREASFGWLGHVFYYDPTPGRRLSTPRVIRKRLSTLIPSRQQRKDSPFPNVRPHAPNTIHTPGREVLSFKGRLKKRLWELGDKLKDMNLKYAVKCGMATSILAAPALFEATRPLFTKYRGEWALISFFVVLSPTIGQTNFLSLHRVMGTMLGAVTAATIYTLFPDNPYVLSVFGTLFSIPCFYYIVSKPQYAISGRFVLLTYNLTALYCYNSRDNDTINPIDIAFRRFCAVTVGVIWAFIVSRWWWPLEARRALLQGLSEFCLNVGWLYTKLVQTYSVPPEELSRSAVLQQTNSGASTLHDTASHLTVSVRHFMAMELHLQLSLIKLQGLLAQTQHEPRLKGPFPVHLYRTILTSLQVILDKLHSMRCVTTREEWYTAVRRDFIIPVNPERREMVGNVILYFSTLASAFTLKRALPPYLPPAEDARQRLVAAIRQLDVVKKREVKQAHHLLYFAYALMMKGVIHELEFLGHTLQDAFGVIGESVQNFEELFTERPGEV